MVSFLPADVIPNNIWSCNTVTSSVHQIRSSRSSWDRTGYSRNCLFYPDSLQRTVLPHSFKTWFTHTKTHHKSKDGEAEEEEEKAEEEDEKEVDDQLLLLHVFTRFLNHLRFISSVFSDCQEAPGGLVCTVAPPLDWLLPLTLSCSPWRPPVWPTVPPNSRTSTSKVQKRTAESPSAGSRGHHPCES